MLKPRLIFTLLYKNGVFNLSRNFNLQIVGDQEWLTNNYEFDSIARSIDELVILNVGKSSENFDDFCTQVGQIARYCFMPIAAGGNIRTIEHASKLFKNGADKIVMNTPFFANQKLITDITRMYGSQAVISSIDFKRMPDGSLPTFIENGSTLTGLDLATAIKNNEALGAGELYLTSIDRDGTGFGYDLQAMELAHNSCQLPIIASGGADTYDKLVEGLHTGYVSAVSTAHLFNFICDGLRDARDSMTDEGIQLSKWSFEN